MFSLPDGFAVAPAVLPEAVVLPEAGVEAVPPSLLPEAEALLQAPNMSATVNAGHTSIFKIFFFILTPYLLSVMRSKKIN
jgi:hypothetical protein